MKVDMKDLLAEGLYKCILEKSFDKITIKQICVKTGVIRGTFYNHFVDKYEALEYLIYSMFLKNDEQDMDLSKQLRYFLEVLYQEKDFFKKCFLIEGQNGFEFIFMKILNDIFNYYINDNELISKDFLCSYYANSILFIIKKWNDHDYSESVNEIYKISYVLLYSNIKNFIESNRS